MTNCSDANLGFSNNIKPVYFSVSSLKDTITEGYPNGTSALQVGQYFGRLPDSQQSLGAVGQEK
mgnify:CR=1 FL=1